MTVNIWIQNVSSIIFFYRKLFLNSNQIIHFMIFNIIQNSKITNGNVFMWSKTSYPNHRLKYDEILANHFRFFFVHNSVMMFSLYEMGNFWTDLNIYRIEFDVDIDLSVLISEKYV